MTEYVSINLHAYARTQGENLCATTQPFNIGTTVAFFAAKTPLQNIIKNHGNLRGLYYILTML